MRTFTMRKRIEVFYDFLTYEVSDGKIFRYKHIINVNCCEISILCGLNLLDDV